MLSVDSFWLNFQKNVPSLALVNNPNTHFLLAYSGGKDSHVLLHIFSELQRLKIVKNIKAIHINHQLHADSAKWAEHCLQQCREYNIPCDVVNVDVDTTPGVSIEAAARQQRYFVFENKLTTNEVLLTAQHADDQVETFFLQALRGSGVNGLASMPRAKKLAKGFLCRPLLGVSQAAVNDYAVKNKLDWIEDPSNNELKFDRNYLRKQVIPIIKKRWPGINNTILRVSELQSESSELQKDLAQIDFTRIRVCNNGLSIADVKELSLSRQKNVLRYWLHSVCKHSMPNAIHLMRIINEVMGSAIDAQPQVQWANSIVRRHQGFIYVDSFYGDEWLEPINDFDYANNYTCSIGFNKIKSEIVIGQGLSLTKIKNKNISIRFRQGGETCRPKGREQYSHKLKTLFQEWGIPSWKRNSIPLVFVGDDLAQVVGYCLCAPFTAKHDEKGCVISLLENNN